MGRVFVTHIATSSYRGWRGPVGQTTFLVLNENMPDGLIKIIFLVEAETAVRSGTKSTFGSVAPRWACGFL